MKPDRFVALDLETTGLDSRRDRIIELGAARVEAGRVAATFGRLARADRPLPAAVARLTGISDAELAAAPPLADSLAEFLEFLGADPLVAHNAPFDAGFLTAATAGRFQRELLDSLELARIVLPEAPSHALEKLAERLQLPPARAHRAEADAERAAHLWLRLVALLGDLPLAVISEMNWLIGPLGHPLGPLLREAEQAALQKRAEKGPGPSSSPEYEALFKSREPPRAKAEEGPGELPPPPRLDAGRLAAELGAAGALARVLDGFEERPEQLRMCRAVAEALNAGRHLMVEAGTGVGKSLAYLLPAAAWAEPAGRRVLISTNTKNLQSQLFGKDLPLLARALGRPVKAALLKGRRNYLCLRKLFHLMREAPSELDDAERAALLPVLVWAPRSETGDVAECSPLFLPAARDLLDKLTSEGPDCLGRACRARRRCPLLAARARAEAAQVIVVNHALVFAELGESAVLPPYAEIVFDEAHNLEGVATDSLSVRISLGRFYRVLNRLFKFRRSAGRKRSGRRRGEIESAGTGLLPALFEQCARARGRAAVGFLERLEKDARAAAQRLVEAAETAGTFCDALRGLWAGAPAGEALRYSAADRRADLWAAPVAAKEALVADLGAVRTRLEKLAQALAEDPEAEGVGRAEELARDLAAAAGRLEELINDLEFTVRGAEPGFVFWAALAGPERDQPELWAAPLEVAPMLAERVWSQKRCCVLCSATMTVEKEFDYLVGRLGLALTAGAGNQGPGIGEQESEDEGQPRASRGRAPGPEPQTTSFDTLLLGTPFDFARQARVFVPAWLAEPGYSETGRNSAELAGMLAGLFKASRGRGLVLFTSYGALDEVRQPLRAALEPEGIAVLAQGRDGSREGLLAALQGDAPAVLLGASSFWEGVDVRGPALSCLVVARLPFPVPTEPLWRARSELVEARGRSAFMDYALPEAVLKFRQGFGRLIRSKADRGVAVLADKRLVARRYGSAFLRSLPGPWQELAGQEQLERAVAEFLGR